MRGEGAWRGSRRKRQKAPCLLYQFRAFTTVVYYGFVFPLDLALADMCSVIATTTFVFVLSHLSVALHQGANAVPTTFSDLTGDNNSIAFLSQSCPLCGIEGRRTDYACLTL